MEEVGLGDAGHECEPSANATTATAQSPSSATARMARVLVSIDLPPDLGAVDMFPS